MREGILMQLFLASLWKASGAIESSEASAFACATHSAALASLASFAALVA